MRFLKMEWHLLSRNVYGLILGQLSALSISLNLGGRHSCARFCTIAHSAAKLWPHGSLLIVQLKHRLNTL